MQKDSKTGRQSTERRTRTERRTERERHTHTETDMRFFRCHHPTSCFCVVQMPIPRFRFAALFRRRLVAYPEPEEQFDLTLLRKRSPHNYITMGSYTNIDVAIGYFAPAGTNFEMCAPSLFYVGLFVTNIMVPLGAEK